MTFDSEVRTSTTARQPVCSRPHPHMVMQASIKIRSLGTGTYLAIGGGNAAEFRISNIGEDVGITSEKTDANGKKLPFDLTELFTAADTADVTYEAFWENVI